MKTFTIARILGNELPPRDTCGSRLEVLKYIINHEHIAPNTVRLWLLNRIPDNSYFEQLREVLEAADQQYVVEHIDWPAYTAAGSRSDKLRILININQARNRCIYEGRKLADFTVVLDGDCFFDNEAWLASSKFVLEDQIANPWRKYYAHSSHRLTLESMQPVHEGTIKLEEAMVVFRHDADLVFDESLPFGQGDKQEFLMRVGLEQRGESWHQITPSSLCAIGGLVRHLQTGPDDVESDVLVRMSVRKKSLTILLSQADKMAEQKLVQSRNLANLIHFVLTKWLIALKSLFAEIREFARGVKRRVLHKLRRNS